MGWVGSGEKMDPCRSLAHPEQQVTRTWVRSTTMPVARFDPPPMTVSDCMAPLSEASLEWVGRAMETSALSA